MSAAPGGSRRSARLLWLLVAAAGGVVWGLAFGRHPWTLASWLALAPLPVLLGAAGGRGRSFLLGFVHGLAAWLAGIPWIAPTLVSYGEMPGWLAGFCLLLLCSYLALFHGLFALLGRRLWQGAATARGATWALVGLPALWVVLEWLRGHLFGGFPWNPAAHAWLSVPGALPAAAWIGVYGVSALVVAANSAVALAVARRRPVWAAAGLLPALLVLALGARFGSAEVFRPVELVSGGEPVALLQPNIPNAVHPDWTTLRRNYAKVLEQSRGECRPGSLLVWPESAAWPYSFAGDPDFRRDLLGLVDRGGCSLLFNSVQPVGERYYNSAFLLSPSGAAERYDKRHLVPFGEYVPFAGVFGWVDKLARNAGDFVAADRVRLLTWGRERLGVAICFEVVFPDEVAAAVRAGATVLVTITNDAWYGDTAAPWQHYAAARFRAAESRRPLLRSAITGVSAVVAPDGRERARLDPFVEGVIDRRIHGRRRLTPFSRAPWTVPLVCALLALAALIVGRRQP